MLITLLIIGLAFAWMLKETNFLRDRYLIGKDKPKFSQDMPYSQQSAAAKSQGLILCRNCRNKCHKDAERWTGWKIPARIIHFYGSTLNMPEQCNILRASLLRDIDNAQKRKASVKIAQLGQNLITQERTGSHRVFHETTPKHGYNQIVEDYTTHYSDCLPGKTWLKAHQNDLQDFEPTIDISVDGKTLSVNGNYKRGLIRDFVKSK